MEWVRKMCRKPKTASISETVPVRGRTEVAIDQQGRVSGS